MKSKTVDFLGRGWSFPIEPVGGKIAFAAAEEKIHQSIILILSTGLGERVMQPEFGSRLKELVFSMQNATTQALAIHYTQESLRRWEPRITVTAVTAKSQTVNILNIYIDYIIRATNVPKNLVYPFYIR